MKDYKECVFLFIVCILQSEYAYGQLGNLTCKLCDRATSLDFCSGSVRCSVDESCYMEELITDQLSVVYNAGCRSKDVCKAGISGASAIGKRGDLVACSRCCNRLKKSGTLDCNARLCGIKYVNTKSTRCYQCDSGVSNADQGDVETPQDCLSETTCQTNETCTLLTQVALKRKDECLTNPDPEICGNVGIGKRSGTTLCTACCGDGLCNSGTCEEIIDRLFNLWKGGALNFTTLKQTGKPKPYNTVAVSSTTTNPPTTASTSTAPPTTASTSTAPPTTASTSTAPPTTSSTSAAPQTTASISAAPQTTSSTSTAPPTTASTSAAPQTTASTSAAPQTTASVSKAPPTTASTSLAASTAASTSSIPLTTVSTSAVPIITPTTAASSSIQTLNKTVTLPPPTKLPTKLTPQVAGVVVTNGASTAIPSPQPSNTPVTVISPNSSAIIG